MTAGTLERGSFPRLQARTRRFTLGVPRDPVAGVGPEGPVVLFLRSDDGTDPVQHLWRHDPVTAETVRLVDARGLGNADEPLSSEERARRERAREQAGGIVSFAVDDGCTVAAFVHAGGLHTVDVLTGRVSRHVTEAPPFDPRPSPDGRCVAYHADHGLHVLDLHEGAGTTRTLVREEGVDWGRAEFVAAEEMGRSRGHWWSGDSASLAVARVDEREVDLWHVADPSHPWVPAVPHRYPAAGTRNAGVMLSIVDAGSGRRTPVAGDLGEYLARVRWGRGPLTLLVQSRDQRTARVLTVDPATGTARVVREQSADPWVELVAGTPAWAGQRLVTVEDLDDTRRLCLDGEPVTAPGLQVRAVAGADAAGVWFTASDDDPTQVHVGHVELPRARVTLLTRDQPGVHRVAVGRATPGAPQEQWSVLTSASLDRVAPRVEIVPGGRPGSGRELDVASAHPQVSPDPRLLELGERGTRAALLLPAGTDRRTSLPVVLDPYGGPHAQRVLQAPGAFLTSQWLADQGFAVLVVDGRGSPGRGPAWERAVHGDLAKPVLEDQVDALQAAADIESRLDLDRVGIRGWSFGGYLAALAVLRRPDVFRAAVAGAPVTDWRLYDTHYTERYLGHPETSAEAYRASSLVDGAGRLPGAAPWDPHDPPALLLVHGLADDNVVAAHTLRLSAALLADGRPHQVLPLTGVTHMTPQEVVAEHLLTLQADFLAAALRR